MWLFFLTLRCCCCCCWCINVYRSTLSNFIKEGRRNWTPLPLWTVLRSSALMPEEKGGRRKRGYCVAVVRLGVPSSKLGNRHWTEIIASMTCLSRSGPSNRYRHSKGNSLSGVENPEYRSPMDSLCRRDLKERLDQLILLLWSRSTPGFCPYPIGMANKEWRGGRLSGNIKKAYKTSWLENKCTYVCMDAAFRRSLAPISQLRRWRRLFNRELIDTLRPS